MPPLNRHRPPTWYEATDKLKVFYFHKAAGSLGKVFRFTLNLSPKIEAQARSQADALDWLKRRVAKELKAIGDAPCEFWVVAEEERYCKVRNSQRRNPGLPRLHLHGEIIADNMLRESIRKALRLAGGEWEDTRQFQAWLGPRADWWPSYVCKDHWRRSRLLMDHPNPHRLTFHGSPLKVTSKINRQAKLLFDHDRLQVIYGGRCS
jgi:hypothetical protein